MSEKTTPEQSLAMQPSGRNCSPPPEVVLRIRKLIFPEVFERNKFPARIRCLLQYDTTKATTTARGRTTRPSIHNTKQRRVQGQGNHVGRNHVGRFMRTGCTGMMLVHAHVLRVFGHRFNLCESSRSVRTCKCTGCTGMLVQVCVFFCQSTDSRLQIGDGKENVFVMQTRPFCA